MWCSQIMTFQLATLHNSPWSNQLASQVKTLSRLQILINISKFIGYSRLASVGAARLLAKISSCNIVLVFLLMNNACPFSAHTSLQSYLQQSNQTATCGENPSKSWWYQTEIHWTTPNGTLTWWTLIQALHSQSCTQWYGNALGNRVGGA